MRNAKFKMQTPLLLLLAVCLGLAACDRDRDKSNDRIASELTGGDPEKGRHDIMKSGCDTCHSQGYSGRIAIHELMVMDDKLKELVMQTQDANVIRRKAVENGMITLRKSAVSKVLDGITSLEEAIQKTQTEDLD